MAIEEFRHSDVVNGAVKETAGVFRVDMVHRFHSIERPLGSDAVVAVSALSRAKMPDSIADILTDGQQAGARYRLVPPRRAPQGLAGSQLGRLAGESMEFMDHRNISRAMTFAASIGQPMREAIR